MKTPELQRSLLQDFREYLFRNTLAEALEHTREYCRSTHQEHLLLSEPWFNFARVVRNALTHDGIIRFDKKKAPPPITFYRWTLRPEHEGQPIASITPLASTATIPVLQAARTCIETRLS